MDTPEIGAAPAAETTAAGDLGDGAQHAAMGRDRPRDAVDPSKTGFLGTLGQFVWGADRAEDGGEPHQEIVEVPRGSDVVVRITLALIGVLAFAVRVFSVVKYESVIHEFDPYFNYRVVLYIKEHGIREFLNWFDDRTWYPLGRVVGSTTYAGLIYTALLAWGALQALHLDVDLREVCVYIGPVFAVLAAWATYAMVCEARPGVQGVRAGLVAAMALALSPAYVSRSAAGAFDLEAVAIFAIMCTFWLYLKTINTGRLSWAVACCLSFWYLAGSWGGYTYVINLIPLHVVACVLTGRFTARLYVAFAPLVALGTIMAATVPPIKQNAVTASEHLLSFFALALLHFAMLAQYLKRLIPASTYRRAKAVFLVSCVVLAALAGFGVALKMSTSATLGWTGRSLSLLDPTYAAKHMPLIASVSEHQPPAWPNFMMDVGPFMLLAPAGIVLCLAPLTYGTLFLLLFGSSSMWFTGVMIRLMLLLAPSAAALGGLGASWVIDVGATSLRAWWARDMLGDGADAEGAREEAQKGQAGQGAWDGGVDSEGDRAWLEHQGIAVSEGAEAGLARLRSFRLSVDDDSGDDAAPQAEGGAEGAGGTRRASAEGGNGVGAPGRAGQEARRAFAERKVAAQEARKASRGWVGASLREWRDQRPLKASARVLPPDVACVALAVVLGILTWNLLHGVWVAANVYSSPSIWLEYRSKDGPVRIDDFREAYAWLESNTPRDATIGSWWDYGYQAAQMSDRITLTDNNTWNTTHIATVARALSSPERQGWEILRQMGADYFFVLYGGNVNYPPDDMNKFSWIIKIASKEYPEIKEDLIYSLDNMGQYFSVGPRSPKYLRDSLMYKLSYHRIHRDSHFLGSDGDSVRGEMPVPVDLAWFDEVYSTQRQMMRIYRLRDPPLRPGGKPLPARD